MQNEVWKDIPEYEGLYQVSSIGRVRSYDRKVYQSGYCRVIKGRYIAQHISNGYKRVGLTNKDGVHEKIRVHVLVAIAFCGHKRNGFEKVVNHIDNNPLNNNYENLESVTQRYNASCHKKGYSSKYVGVCYLKKTNKWRASIRIDGVLKHIGNYNTEIEARDAYQDYLKSIS